MFVRQCQPKLQVSGHAFRLGAWVFGINGPENRLKHQNCSLECFLALLCIRKINNLRVFSVAPGFEPHPLRQTQVLRYHIRGTVIRDTKGRY